MDYNTIYGKFVGIDECARGNFFGPCIFCGVKLKVPYQQLSFAVDSKTTTKEYRKKLYSEIIDKVDFHLEIISPADIDQKGLSVCIKNALENILAKFKGEFFLYDGKCTFGVEHPRLKTLVKADAKVISVSCASIIAKYTLDNIMEEYHKQYPNYGFDTHAGYATKKHIAAVKEYGYLPDHRRSYNVKELAGLEQDETNILF